MRWLVGALVVIVLTAGVAAAAVHAPDHDPHDRLPPLPSGTAAAVVTTSTSVQPAIVPAGGQSLVTGRADHITIDGAVLDPIPTPLTVTTPERGLGAGARIEGALVGGQPATIQWDAGTPFVLRGGSGLATDPVHVEIGPAGAVVRLDGAVHGFVPGRYELDSPVAVGRSGLATPEDRVTFDATDRTTVEFTGNATVPLPGERWVVKGPGTIDAQGDFSVRTASGRGERGHFRFGEGAFELTVTRVAGTLQVEATLQGPLSGS